MGMSPLTLSTKSPRCRNKKDWLSQKVQGKERFFPDSSRCWELPRTALNKHSTLPLAGALGWIREETASWLPTLSFFLTMDASWPPASVSCSHDSPDSPMIDSISLNFVPKYTFLQVAFDRKNRQYREKGCVIMFRFGSQFEESQSAMVLRTEAGLWMKSKQGWNRKWSYLTLSPASPLVIHFLKEGSTS